MISSARIRIVGGTLKFEALAVLRLTTSSNLVLLDGDVSRPPAFEDQVYNLRAAPPLLAMIGPIGHETACLRELTVAVDSGQTQAGSGRGNLGPLT